MSSHRGLRKVSERAFARRTREFCDRLRREEHEKERAILASYPIADDLPLGQPMRLDRRETR
jgi:hypothetical protein